MNQIEAKKPVYGEIDPVILRHYREIKMLEILRGVQLEYMSSRRPDRSEWREKYRSE